MMDKTITCLDCGQEFVWTSGEQDFYEDKGISIPKYCMVCRAKRRVKKEFEDKYKKD